MWDLDLDSDPTIAVTLFVIMTLAGCALSGQQSREGGGSRARRLGVSVVMAALGTLPLLTHVLIGTATEWPRMPDVMVLLIAVFSLVRSLQFLLPPVRLAGTKEALPEVLEDAFVARVGEMSRGLGIEPPRVRQLGSVGGSLDAHAMAGGLVKPSLVVTDGVLHRLDRDERDAIVAHELAHVSTGSIWVFAIAGPVLLSVGVAIGGFVDPLIGFLGAVSLMSLGVRLLRRHFELRCDRAAAEVVGYRSTMAALGKIHQIHVVPDRGAASLAFYATATHPHRVLRLAALFSRAPAEERCPLDAALADAGKHRAAALVGFSVWGLAIAAAYAFGDDERSRWWLLTVLLAFLAQSWALMLLVVGGRMRRARRRIGIPPPGRRLAHVALALLLFGPFARYVLDQPGLGVGSFLLGVGAFVTSATRRLPCDRVRASVGAALLRRDYRGAIDAAEARPRVLARDPALQHDVAVCRALCGDRDAAERALSALARNHPRLLATRFSLATMNLSSDPAAALEHARAAAEELPDDPLPLLLMARASLKLGRLPDVAGILDRAAALDHDEARVHVVRAELLLERDDVEGAAHECRLAQEKGPGEASERLVRAKLAIASESYEQARRMIDAAVEAAEAAPFSFLQDEALALEDALDRRVATGAER